MLLIWYPKCTTCQKAKKWLDDNGIDVGTRHIKEENPSYDELKEWYKKADFRSRSFSIQAVCFTNPCSSRTSSRL